MNAFMSHENLSFATLIKKVLVVKKKKGLFDVVIIVIFSNQFFIFFTLFRLFLCIDAFYQISERFVFNPRIEIFFVFECLRTVSVTKSAMLL